MAVTDFLVDTSAVVRLGRPDFETWRRALHNGLLATCAAVDIEVLRTPRNGSGYERLRQHLRDLYEHLPMPDEVWDRALDVQRTLAAVGKLRAVGLADLVIAAAAERAGVALLHYDRDFDQIAEITGQPTRWAAPPDLA